MKFGLFACAILIAGTTFAADCMRPNAKLAGELAERARLLVESRLPDAAMTRWLQGVQTKAEALAEVLASRLPPGECEVIAKELADGRAAFEPVYAHFAAELEKRAQARKP